MTGAWSRWVAFLDVRETGTSLALVRTALGLVVAGALLDVMGPPLDAMWLAAPDGYATSPKDPWLVTLLGGRTPALVRGLAAAGVGLALLVAAGVGGVVGARLLSFATLHVLMTLTGLNDDASGSYDHVLTNGLWLLTLAGPSRTLSLDCRVRTGRWTSEETVARWPRWLCVVQLVLMYGTSGWQKLSVHWVPGGELSALWYILQQPTWQRADMRWVAHVYPLTQVGTLVTWLWEVTAPLWLLAWHAEERPAPGWRAWLVRLRVRDLYAATGAFFHVAVGLLMAIGPFGPASLALYPACWAPGAWERRLGLARDVTPPSRAAA